MFLYSERDVVFKKGNPRYFYTESHGVLKFDFEIVWCQRLTCSLSK